MDFDKGPWLLGYAMTGFKGLKDAALVKVGPLSKINFLVGRNNHGKSTVMDSAKWWMEPQGAPFSASATLHRVPRKSFEAMVNRLDAERSTQLIAAGDIVPVDDQWMGIWVDGIVPHLKAQRLSSIVTGYDPRGRGLPGVRLEDAVGPSGVVAIPAFRQIRQARADASKAGKSPSPLLARGEGLVFELGRWYAPTKPGSPDYHRARERWQRLRAFMRDVLEEPEADLEIANNQEDLHIRLSQAGEMLHIDQLGDGIKQVLMIAATSIVFDNHLVLLEEPEIHLHAGLQRKLMHFLLVNTNNQYVIATHSAHILDVSNARVFHVTHDGESTRVSPAVSTVDVHRVCQDLGYMASDILQANYTIWVEGPSDRVYWRSFVQLVDDSLIEGVHFVIMVYGGYLIDRVHILGDVEDPIEADLIGLLRLGRQCTVIADSDKKTEGDQLRATLNRLIEESRTVGSGRVLICAWVSTVENLLPRKLFREVVQGMHPTSGARLAGELKHTPFSPPFAGMGNSTYSKVDVAQEIVKRLSKEDMSENLTSAATELVERIRIANGLSRAE